METFILTSYYKSCVRDAVVSTVLTCAAYILYSLAELKFLCNGKEMSFANFNQSANNSKTTKFRDLNPGQIYTVDEINLIEARYGKCYTIKLDNSISTFLPSRTTRYLLSSPETVFKLLESIKNKTLLLKFIDQDHSTFEFLCRGEENK